ncbi:MAG: DUF6364 family protein [Candidatus Eremiobacteraeota bacterium]|nr:DUF6364 family protein [Candidatus Eremiobacteraeota bacterium]
MAKGKLNITLDSDLIQYVKMYASENRTTVSEVVGQFLLNLKRARENDPTEIIFSDPSFKETMLECLDKIRSGRMKWHSYKEVFK